MIQCGQFYTHFCWIWKHWLLLIWLKNLAGRGGGERELNAAYVMTKNEALDYKLRQKVNPEAILLPTLMEPYLVAYWEKNVANKSEYIQVKRNSKLSSKEIIEIPESPHLSFEGDFKLGFAYSCQGQITWKQPRKSSSTTGRLLLHRKFQKSDIREKLLSTDKVWETSHVINSWSCSRWSNEG